MTDAADRPPEPPPARFADRLNAFALDASIFSAGFFLSAWVVAAAQGARGARPAFLGVWLALWAALFVLYHAYLSCEGRRTLGKSWFGLEVVEADGGEPPGFGRALLRAVAYGASSLVFAVGFLWALKGGRALHDHIAGTRVVEVEPRGKAFRRLSAAGAWFVAVCMVVGWFALVAVGPGMARMKLIAQGRQGMKALAALEEERLKTAGAYSGDLDALLALEPDGRTVAQGLRFALNRDTIRIESDGKSYSITAEALDEERTVLRITGPAAAGAH